MKNDAPIDEKEQEQETPKSLLEELIREGARRLLQAAIEQEVTEYLERFRKEKDDKGHRIDLFRMMFRGHHTFLVNDKRQEHYDPTMARIARVVAPGLPLHVTQRGNRRQKTFFCDDDYRAYLELMAQWCSRCAWAREGTGPQPLQAKTGAETQSTKQISIVSPKSRNPIKMPQFFFIDISLKKRYPSSESRRDGGASHSARDD